MPITHLDLYELKAEFLPPTLDDHRRYVLPGTPSPHVNPAQWELVLRCHATRAQVDLVIRKGYFDIRPKAGGDVSKRAAARYAAKAA
jgi:hypothetical protein